MSTNCAQTHEICQTETWKDVRRTHWARWIIRMLCALSLEQKLPYTWWNIYNIFARIYMHRLHMYFACMHKHTQIHTYTDITQMRCTFALYMHVHVYSDAVSWNSRAKHVLRFGHNIYAREHNACSCKRSFTFSGFGFGFLSFQNQL